MELLLNDYGLEFDSYMGSIYLPWHTIALATALLVGVKLYNKIKSKKVAPLITLDDNDDWMTK
jgi:hypothetical protein